MSETLLSGGGTATVDPVVQTITELEQHVAALPEAERGEFQKLDATARVAALSTVKQTREVTAYSEKLPAEQRAEFDKLKPEEKVSRIGSERKLTDYASKLAPEAKTEFDKLTPEQKTAKIAEAEKADAIPDKYEFKLPKDFTMSEDGAKDAEKLFRDLGLSQSKAQTVMDKYVEVATKAAKAGETQLEEQRKQWVADFTKDSKQKELLMLAKRGLATGTTEFQSLVSTSWLGDHPDVIRFLAKVGESVKEDTTVHGKGGDGGNTQKTVAQTIYPGLPSKPY